MLFFIKDNKLLKMTEPKTVYFDLPKDVDSNRKHGIGYMIKHDEFLVGHTIKTIQLLSKYNHGSDVHMNTENSNIIALHQFVLNLSDTLDLRSSNKHV